MTQIRILAVLFIFVFVQISNGRDLAEAVDDNIRLQLTLYDKLQKEADGGGKYAEELKKLIELTENALKIESPDEKNHILSAAPSQFSEAFNKWITTKFEEAHVNADIHDAIEYYSSLLVSNAKHEVEIKQIISTLQSLLRETDLKEKENRFLALENTFSAEFQKVLKENSLQNVNRQLKMSVEFFENLLHDKDVKYANEIEVLKLKAEAALGNAIAADEKLKVLHEIYFTRNEQLNEFLQGKSIEYS